MTICDKLRREVRSEIREMITYTAGSGKEVNMKICLKKDNSFIGGPFVTGTPSRVSNAPACPVDTVAVGDIHTHPGSMISPSDIDIKESSVLDFRCMANRLGQVLCIDGLGTLNQQERSKLAKAYQTQSGVVEKKTADRFIERQNLSKIETIEEYNKMRETLPLPVREALDREVVEKQDLNYLSSRGLRVCQTQV